MNETQSFRYSIVIPVYNGQATLPATLDRLIRLKGAAYEILVVDDGSTDNTASMAEGYGVQVIRMPQNAGPATARTEGAKAAQGEILVFTDDDVWVPEDLLVRLERNFSESGAAAVQGTFSRHCPHPNLVSQYKNLYNRHVILRLPDWIDTTYTSATAVEKDCFFTCGGFDTNIRGASVEDRTLGRNLVRAGFRIYLDRNIEVVHNKYLSLWGLIRNQWKRSRDLARLLLRNREEKKNNENPKQPSAPPSLQHGRFGTNAPSTMARLPAAYLTVLCFLISVMPTESSQWFALLGLISLIAFGVLAWPLTAALARERGWLWAFGTIPLNFLDALACGAGVLWGIVSYLVLGRRY